MSLLQQVIAGWPSGRRAPGADYAAALRANDEDLLPPPVALDIDLRSVACAADAMLVGEETRHKVAMLAADRQFIALLFDCAATSAARTRHQLTACDAVRSCLGDRGRSARMLISTAVQNGSLPLHYAAHGHDIEYALVVDIDAKPANLTRFLAALSPAAKAGRSTSHTEVWLRQPHGIQLRDGDDELLAVAADGGDAVSLTLLATGASGHRGDDGALYAAIVAHLDERGLRRQSPCRYQRSATRRSSIASLLGYFPQLDVLGIGAGAVSHVQPLRFVNHDAASAHRAAVANGEDAIASASTLGDLERLVSEISGKLLAGVGIDLSSVLEPYRVSAPGFATALSACLEDFERRELLSADPSGHLLLGAAADRQLGGLIETLQTLLPLPDSPNVVRLAWR